MTAGTNGHGNGTPEDDDPFAYLYRQEGGEGHSADAATQVQPQYGQPGVPRTSYNQVTRVGQNTSRQGQRTGGYGYPPQSPPQGGYGYPPQQAQSAPPEYGQPDYGQPTYAQPQYAPEPQADPAYSGGGSGGRRGAGRSGGGNGNRGLLIGAVAVVAAVAVVIAIVMLVGDNGKDDKADNPRPSASHQPSQDDTKKPTDKPVDELPPVTDASAMVLEGGAAKSTERTGALGKDGVYVDHMNTPGAAATWQVKVPEAGRYRFNVHYGNAGEDATATLVVNGKPQKLGLDNYTHKDDWSQAWTKSYGLVTLKAGKNTIAVTCGSDDQCEFNLDQIALTRSGYPAKWP
ncbi:CBM35 domain-containing protein [Wenjunlia tyrosinilytica]|uniref:CBM6 domain-containing protein n=1 Tax=Wenjunlia tyrosinilytica TaxID=1544741 RepID=A0A917ZNP1_9ACTN|nr:CBM35 domain-containing protein [Wenjunlia tyrosinilytica]GGO87065.1 hypothetical protein GCM10012280_24690 [Wenjunlia tyrosinilytica]